MPVMTKITADRYVDDEPNKISPFCTTIMVYDGRNMTVHDDIGDVIVKAGECKTVIHVPNILLDLPLVRTFKKQKYSQKTIKSGVIFLFN